MAGGLLSSVLFYNQNILLLGCLFVAVGFFIYADVLAIGNVLTLPIILVGPKLGKKHKKWESLKSFTDSLCELCFKPIVEFRFGPHPITTHLSEGKLFFS